MDKRENSSQVYSNTGERKYCQCSLVMETLTNQIQKGLLRTIISTYSTQPDGKENLCASAEVSLCTCSTLQTEWLKPKSSVTTSAWPNLTVPLGQHLKAGLSQSFLRGMKAEEKVTHPVSAHSLWQKQECGSTLRLLQHLVLPWVVILFGWLGEVSKWTQRAQEIRVISLNRRH